MRSKNIFLHVILFFIITGIFLTVYTAIQQNYRMNANDPQIEISQEVARAMNSGAQAQTLVGNINIDIKTNLAPFLMIFDTSGKLISSSAKLNGQNPSFPTSVFDYVKSHGEDRVTWQPQQGVRMATVAVPYNSGYIVVGRSLREVEKRIDNLTKMVGLAWGAAVLLLIFSFVFSGLKKRKNS